MVLLSYYTIVKILISGFLLPANAVSSPVSLSSETTAISSSPTSQNTSSTSVFTLSSSASPASVIETKLDNLEEFLDELLLTATTTFNNQKSIPSSIATSSPSSSQSISSLPSSLTHRDTHTEKTPDDENLSWTHTQISAMKIVNSAAIPSSSSSAQSNANIASSQATSLSSVSSCSTSSPSGSHGISSTSSSSSSLTLLSLPSSSSSSSSSSSYSSLSAKLSSSSSDSNLTMLKSVQDLKLNINNQMRTSNSSEPLNGGNPTNKNLSEPSDYANRHNGSSMDILNLSSNSSYNVSEVTTFPELKNKTTHSSKLSSSGPEAKEKLKETSEPSVEKNKEESVPQGPLELDSDGIIKDSNFLSFEEWKKKRVGDDPNLQRPSSSKKVQRETPKSNDMNLNGVIGEELEIELSMFSSSASNGNTDDQGGKLYKDKFNFASFDCAATIVKTNSEAKGASAVLNENKDTYLLNECSAPNKFIIIELCEDILVSEISIGNYEFFSSMFHKVRFSVSDRFPVPQGGWKVLGEFEAENLRNLQTFAIKNPLIWAKFLRVEVLSVYGNEFYCPITTVQVHGTTMIEQFKMDESGTEDTTDLEEMEELELKGGPITDFKLFNESAEFGSRMQQLANEYSVPAAVKSKSPEEKSTASEKFSDTQNTSTETEDDSGDCRVTPYLGLEKFLEELSADDFCFPDSDPGLDDIMEQTSKASIPASSEPVTQESIYKNLAKRLALLESNATLSLLYIEEQSRILSSAFDKLEQRQSNRFEQVVSSLNSTIHEQITLFNSMHIAFTQRAVSLLNLQAASNNNVLDNNAKQLNDLSQQLVNQKRLGVMNTIIIVSLLIYIVVTRDTYIEADFIENIPSAGGVTYLPEDTYVPEADSDGQAVSTFSPTTGSSVNYSTVVVSNSPSSSEPGSPGSSIYYKKKRSMKGLTNLFFTDKIYTGRTYSAAASLKDKGIKITLDQVDHNTVSIGEIGDTNTNDSEIERCEDNDYTSDEGDQTSQSVHDENVEDVVSKKEVDNNSPIVEPDRDADAPGSETKELNENVRVSDKIPETTASPNSKGVKEISIGKSLKKRISSHKFL